MILLFLLLLLPSWAYAGVPPTLNTWYSIPNSTLQPLCPDPNIFLECKYITIAWSSASLDQGSGFYIIHGGGHNNYWGNEIYRLNLNQLGLAGSLVQQVPPSTPVAADLTSPDCIGTPCVSNSKHLYDGFVWMDALSQALIIGGSPAKNGGFTNSIWTMDPSQTTPGAIWTRLTPNYGVSGTGGSGQTQVIGVIPASNRDKVWSCAYAEQRHPDGTLWPIAYCFDQLNLYAIDRVANTMRSLTNRNTIRQFYMTAAYDPVHKVVALLGGADSTFATFDVSGGPTVQVPGSGDASLVNRPTTGATAIVGETAPGFTYDADLDRMTAWGAGSCLNCIYVADMTKALANDPGTWTTITTTGAPDPNIEPASGNHGVYKRWNYWKKGRMYIYLGSVSTNMMALRLVAPDNAVRIKETTGSTQTNRPVSFGRPFRQGDVANCPEAWINGATVTTQTDVKSRWPDGSLKFGIVSFVVPSMTASSTTTAYLINNPASGSCNNTGGLTQAQALDPSYNFDVTMQLVGTSTVTASARAMLTAGAATTWLTGPVVTSFIIEDKTAARPYDMAPNGVKTMHPQFQCDFYPSLTKAYCSVVLENAWISNTLGNSTRDEALTYSLTAGITPVAKAVNWNGDTSEDMTTHKFTGMSRSHITLWVGTAPGSILVDHSLPYLGSTRLVPNFSPLTINAARLTTEKTAWSGLTTSKRIQGTFNGTNDPIGNWDRLGADGGGGHPWVGLFPTWDVMYLYNMANFDQTLQDKFFGNADLWGRIQLHMRELDVPAGRGLYFDNAYSTAHTAALGRHLSISARKEVTTSDFSDTCSGTIGTDKINQAATIEWTSYSPRWAPHHAPGADYLQYLLSGRYFYLEETQMQAAYYLAWAHGCVGPGSGRQGDAGYFVAGANNEVRGAAWAYRSMEYAYTVSPDGTPEKTYWDWYTRQNLALLAGQSGVTNTDSQHTTAFNYGNTNFFFTDGPSATGEWTRYLDDGGTAVLREDGTPSRNVQNCNGVGFTCANAPWMENFLLSALGMAYGTGLNVDNLLAFRAKYNFGISLGQVNTAFGDAYRIPGKVERSYSVPAGTGQGWMLQWSDLLQYAQPKSTFCGNCGSDQRYQFIMMGANAFLAPVGGVYNSDGGTAYTAYRNSLNAAQPLTAQFDGSLSTSDPTYDSPKWDMLPWTVTAAGSALPAPPQPPNPASNVRVQLIPSTPTIGISGTVPSVGSARDVVVDSVNNLAYVASGEFGLSIVDVTTPASPVTRGVAIPPFYGERVDVNGSLAVVSSGSLGLSVVDVSSTLAPRTVGTLANAGTIRDVVMGTSRYAFALQVVAGNPAHTDLVSIDLITPSTPTIVGRVTLAGGANLAVVGTLAYVATGTTSFQIVDVSTPASPSITSTTVLPSVISAVTVLGRYAYVGGSTATMVVDVLVPATPSLVGTVAVTSTAMTATTNRLYSVNGLQFYVIDVTTPASPAVLSTTTGPQPQGVAVSGTTVFLASSNVNASTQIGGLYVVNVANAASPQILTNIYGGFGSFGVAVSGSLSVATGNSLGMQVLDISSAVPQKKGRLTGTIKEVAMSGAFAYQEEVIPGNPAHTDLEVVSLSNPSTPSIVGRVTLAGEGGLRVVGSTVYVAVGTAGLQIVNVATPTAPAILSTLSTGGTATDVTVAGTLAYVANTTTVQIVDVTTPTAPAIVSSISTAATLVVASGSRFYAMSSTQLKTYDRGIPQSPALLSTIANFSAQAIDANGTFVFLATPGVDHFDTTGGVYVVDASNGASPVLKEKIITPGLTRAVAGNAGLLYAGDAAGLIDVINY